MTKSGKPKRWFAQRKLDVVMRLFMGEPIDDVSRDTGVEIYRLEEWKQEAMAGMESRFKKKSTDPMAQELARAKQKIGELSMENELLREKAKKIPLAWRMSRK
jgi:transposase